MWLMTGGCLGHSALGLEGPVQEPHPSPPGGSNLSLVFGAVSAPKIRILVDNPHSIRRKSHYVATCSDGKR